MQEKQLSSKCTRIDLGEYPIAHETRLYVWNTVCGACECMKWMNANIPGLALARALPLNKCHLENRFCFAQNGMRDARSESDDDSFAVCGEFHWSRCETVNGNRHRSVNMNCSDLKFFCTPKQVQVQEKWNMKTRESATIFCTKWFCRVYTKSGEWKA